MKLHEMRLQRNLQQKDLAILVDTDEPMISRFENYKCLPIPPMMSAILSALDCDLSDIYENKEITYKRKQREPAELNCYKLTVRLPKEAKEFLNLALRKCGYRDVTYWIYRCYERLQKQYEIITKAESLTACKHEALRK